MKSTSIRQWPETEKTHRVIYLGGDSALLKGLVARDVDALAAVYDIHAPYVQTALTRILGCGDDAIEDCLQDTFTRVFYRAGQVRNADYLKTWITRIAIHCALDYLRKKKRERWLQFAAPDTLPDIQVPPRDLADSEAMDAVYRVLNALPPKERICFTLRKIEQMPLAEIAQVTGVSLATVKRRVAAAQKRFTRLAGKYPSLESWLNDNGCWRP